MQRYDAVEVGRRLREMRGIRTRIGVSKETGIGLSALQGYEQGRRTPDPDTMIILANYYNTSVQHLFFDQW